MGQVERRQRLPIDPRALLGRLRDIASGGQNRPAIEPSDRRVEELSDRLERLETVVEGLQDAVYRESQRLEARIDEVRARTAPEEMARALNEDTRRRGL